MEQRRLIGAIAAVLLATGAITGFLPQSFGTATPSITAASTRVGVIMSALWLAFPDLHRIPRWMWIGGSVTLALIALRPRAALVIVPALGVAWWIFPKSVRNRPDRGSS